MATTKERVYTCQACGGKYVYSPEHKYCANCGRALRSGSSVSSQANEEGRAWVVEADADAKAEKQLEAQERWIAAAFIILAVVALLVATSTPALSWLRFATPVVVLAGLAGVFVALSHLSRTFRGLQERLTLATELNAELQAQLQQAQAQLQQAQAQLQQAQAQFQQAQELIAQIQAGQLTEQQVQEKASFLRQALPLVGLAASFVPATAVPMRVAGLIKLASNADRAAPVVEFIQQRIRGRKRSSNGSPPDGVIAPPEDVWKRVAAHGGKTFRLSNAKTFEYCILRGKSIHPIGSSVCIAYSQFEEACRRFPLTGVEAVSDLPGSAYLFAILTDPRVRPISTDGST